MRRRSRTGDAAERSPAIGRRADPSAALVINGALPSAAPGIAPTARTQGGGAAQVNTRCSHLLELRTVPTASTGGEGRQ